MSLTPKYILPPLTKEEYELVATSVAHERGKEFTVFATNLEKNPTEINPVTDGLQRRRLVSLTSLLDKISRPTIKQ